MPHPDVSSSVISIIAAFTNCRDVLRKIRGRCNKKASEKAVALTGAELQLNQSLRRGPVEIDEQYVDGTLRLGHSFDSGDAHARAELTSVLLRLNSGLVDTISNFIKSSDSSKARVGYKALTTLSDASRIQARNSLVALGYRLSAARACTSLEGPLGDHPKAGEAGDERDKTATKSKKAPHRRHKSIPRGEYLAISKQDSETQIALVRPTSRAKKALSAESTSSIKLGSPRPLKETASKKHHFKAARVSPSLDADNQRRRTEHHRETRPGPPKCPQPATPDELDRDALAQSRCLQTSLLPFNATPRETQIGLCINHPENNQQILSNPAPQTQVIPRRRAAVNTETLYTVASTQLGEIPMHKWSEPYDFEQAERLNTEAYTIGWVSGQNDVRQKKSPGLFKRLFRRQPPAGVAEA